MKATEKIDALSYNDIVYIKPLIFALAYTLVFPIATAGFYYVTLQYKRLMNLIQQKIQDVTPLPQEVANQIVRENSELRLEQDKKIQELNEAKERFETNEQSLIDENMEIKKLVEKKEEYLETNNKQLEKREKELIELKRTFKSLEQKIIKIDTERTAYQSQDKKNQKKIAEHEKMISSLKSKIDELRKSDKNTANTPYPPKNMLTIAGKGNNIELIEAMKNARKASEKVNSRFLGHIKTD
ncbi:hypothetical protein C9925_01965, partial [cyanobacterium G8-9]